MGDPKTKASIRRGTIAVSDSGDRNLHGHFSERVGHPDEASRHRHGLLDVTRHIHRHKVGGAETSVGRLEGDSPGSKPWRCPMSALGVKADMAGTQLMSAKCQYWTS